MTTLSSSPLEQSLTAAGVRALVERNLAAVEEISTQLRAFKNQPDEILHWDNTFGAIDRLTDLLQAASGAPQLMSVAHPDEAVRTAAMEGEPKFSAFVTALFLDADVAEVIQRAATRMHDLTPTQQKFVDELLRDFRRNGLTLPTEKQTRLRELNEQLTALGQEFDKNLAGATSSIEVKSEQLAGLPNSYIKNHLPTENGLIRITTDNPDYIPFVQYSKDRTAARELYILHKNRAQESNLPILDKILKLREEKAHLLGYANWADYVLEPRMAKNAKRVADFLEDVRVGVKPGIENEMQVYREIAANLGLLHDGKIWISDAGFIDEIATREHFSVDSQEVSTYFEITSVIQGLMDVAEKLFSLKFEEIKIPTWHQDVRVVEITDAANIKLGRLYLDLHPRDNKYKHAAIFGLQEAIRETDGTRREAACALVCNLAKPGEQPSLLTHAEVTMLFHEFGHALHHLFSDVPLASFSGTNVARDFVEAPSQALEEYAWTREALNMFAHHYQTQEKIPEDLYQKMLKARNFGRAIDTNQQLFYAALDQTYHTRPAGFDSTQVMEELFATYIPFELIPNTHFQGTFGHLIGYDAGYYGYQWALAIARDILTRFDQQGLMNTQTATAYRQEILSKGGSLDESKLVENFLGRPFSTDAYKKFLGVT